MVGLGEEEFVRYTRIGLFDGNIWHGNGLRSVGKFLDGRVVSRGQGFGRGGSRGSRDKRLGSLRNSLRKRMQHDGGLFALRRICKQIFRKFLGVLETMGGLTRGIGVFIVRNLIVGLDVFGGVCLENIPKTVAIVPVTTFYSLAASLASLIILPYLANNMGHLLAVIALERKQLENVFKLLGRLNF